MQFQLYNSLALFADRYQAFILDLWGVVHDGSALYPGVKATLEKLRDKHKHVLLLSNAPRSSVRAQEVLDALGIERNLYEHMVTSGDVTYNFLKTYDAGKHYYYIGPARDLGLTQGLDYVQVFSPDQADFILNVGVEYDEQQLDELLPALQKCGARNLPLLCVNPDLQVVKQTGERYLCAGAIAKLYEELGGSCHYFGKPHPEAYRACFDYFKNTPHDKILAIGDTLETDILGANQAKIDSALVLGGVLKQTFQDISSITEKQKKIGELCQKHQALPTYVIPAFHW